MEINSPDMYVPDINAQPQPPPYPDQYMPMPRMDDTASVIKQIDPSFLLNKIEWNLRGYYTDTDGKPKSEIKTIDGRTIKVKPRPLMNEEGINKILSIASSYITPNTSLSINDKDDIQSRMKNIINHLIVITLENKRKFDIKSHADWVTIMEIVLFPMNMTLKRSYDIGLNDKKFLKGQTVEHIQKIYDQQKQGWSLSSLNPFGRK